MADPRKLQAELRELAIKLNKLIRDLEAETYAPYDEKMASLRHTLAFTESVVNIYANQVERV